MIGDLIGYYQFICSFVHPFIHSFVFALIHSFTYTFIHSLINEFQLSTLKLELASQGKSTSSFHPQSAVINQLQEEIQKLQKQVKCGTTPIPPLDTNVARLQAKLNTAVQRITQLVREKDQLIQMGNKLRAELARCQG